VFDETLINSKLMSAKSALKLAEINLLEAKKEFQRSQELYECTVLSEHDLQTSKIQHLKARSQHAKAENKLTHLLWDKRHHKVHAPYNAVIVKILSYPGQSINNKFAAQTLFIIQEKNQQKK